MVKTLRKSRQILNSLKTKYTKIASSKAYGNFERQLYFPRPRPRTSCEFSMYLNKWEKVRPYFYLALNLGLWSSVLQILCRIDHPVGWRSHLIIGHQAFSITIAVEAVSNFNPSTLWLWLSPAHRFSVLTHLDTYPKWRALLAWYLSVVSTKCLVDNFCRLNDNLLARGRLHVLCWVDNPSSGRSNLITGNQGLSRFNRHSLGWSRLILLLFCVVALVIRGPLVFWLDTLGDVSQVKGSVWVLDIAPLPGTAVLFDPVVPPRVDGQCVEGSEPIRALVTGEG